MRRRSLSDYDHSLTYGALDSDTNSPLDSGFRLSPVDLDGPDEQDTRFPKERAAAQGAMERVYGRSSVPADRVAAMVPTKVGRRTSRYRAWMVLLPVDLIALLTPLFIVQNHWRGVITMAVVTVLLFAQGSLYRGKRHISILDDLPALLGRLLTAAAVVAVVASQRHESMVYVGEFMKSVVVSAVLVVLFRALMMMTMVLFRQKRWIEHGAVVVGGGPLGAELIRLLVTHPRYGLRVTGYLDDDGRDRPARQVAPWLGQVDWIEETILRTGADVIVVADVDADEAKLMEVLRRPECMRCDLYVVPRMHHIHSQPGLSDHIGAIPIVRIRRPRLSGPRWMVKRASDVAVAALGLLVLSPVLILCGVLVLLFGGRGGIFFRQERVGLHGRRFNVIKFRSMRAATRDETDAQWTGDARATTIGRLLRRTSLDELPQLWNILRGDMALVGPRPERPHFVEKFISEHPTYAERHRVPAGLTGLAQVSGLRGDTPISDRARFDNYYIENWSLWLDVKVVLRTFGEVLGARGR